MDAFIIDPIGSPKPEHWSPELEAFYQQLKVTLTQPKPEPYRHPFLNGETQD